MSTITRESIADTIEGLEHLANSGIQSVYIDMAIAGMRRLLASLEAEPDYMRYDCGCCGWETLTDWRDNDVCPKCNHHPMGKTPLYTAPPAPVSVPDAMTPKQASRAYCGEVRGYRDGWNACRAAMIKQQSSIDASNAAVSGSDIKQPSSNSPVIPDGWVLVPEEPTHEMLEAGDEQFGTYDVYRRMITAAPQQ
ncbi:hypothetical protein [Enterobacter ludwigii]|uniref:hypothetical protein n=1 Tax=Enterobacter ludwigii TaxID=299767 RepID=UPI0039750D60